MSDLNFSRIGKVTVVVGLVFHNMVNQENPPSSPRGRVRWTAESAAVFCPEGTVPTTVGPGYYTLGGNETTNRTRVYQKLVERGYFAESGRKW